MAVFWGVVGDLLAAFIIDVPRRLIRRLRASRSRKHSRLRLVPLPRHPTWRVRANEDGTLVLTWSCAFAVTNDGDLPNAPVRGVVRWRRTVSEFTPHLLREVDWGLEGIRELPSHGSAVLQVGTLKIVAKRGKHRLRAARVTITDRFEKRYAHWVRFRPRM